MIDMLMVFAVRIRLEVMGRRLTEARVEPKSHFAVVLLENKWLQG